MAQARSSDTKQKAPAADTPVQARRVDRLAEIVDQCTAAKRVADTIGERFLAYLLAMAIQETRTAMRMEIKTRAKPKVDQQDDHPERDEDLSKGPA